MILPGSYHNGFAPRDGEPLYPELWDGCVGAWNPGLGPTGLRLYDWSAFKNHGTLTNGPTWGVSGNQLALLLDGTNDYVDAGNGSVFHISTAITISAWVNPTSVSGRGNIVSKNTNSGYRFRVDNNNKAWWYVSDNFIDGGSVPLNTWSCISVTGAASGLRIYLNGASVASNTVAFSPSNVTAGSLFIGAANASSEHFNGFMNDIRIYNRVLSQNEIRLLATRRGIAYEMAPRRWSAAMIEAYRRRTQYAQLVGGGII